MKYNLNYNVAIYPNELGWNKIRELLQKAYNFKSKESLEEYIKHRTSTNGAFVDQLWSIMSDLHDMFYNGTQYFDSMNIDLCFDDDLSTRIKKFKRKDVTKVLIDQATEVENLKSALKNILSNTINRDFGNDIMYKSGVLGNIKVAFGEKEFDRLVDYYN